MIYTYTSTYGDTRSISFLCNNEKARKNEEVEIKPKPIAEPEGVIKKEIDEYMNVINYMKHSDKVKSIISLIENKIDSFVNIAKYIHYVETISPAFYDIIKICKKVNTYGDFEIFGKKVLELYLLQIAENRNKQIEQILNDENSI